MSSGPEKRCGTCKWWNGKTCRCEDGAYFEDVMAEEEYCLDWEWMLGTKEERRAKSEERKAERTAGTKETKDKPEGILAKAMQEIDERLAEIIEIENRIEELKKKKLEIRETLCKHKGLMMAVLDRMGRSIKGDKRTRKKFGGRVKRVPKGEQAPGNEPAGEKGRERLKQLREAFGTREFTAAEGAKVCGIEKTGNFHGCVVVGLMGRWLIRVRPGVFRLVEEQGK